MYHVIDTQTKKIIASYPEDKARVARNRANKLDLNYGAIRYVVRFVEKDA